MSNLKWNIRRPVCNMFKQKHICIFIIWQYRFIASIFRFPNTTLCLKIEIGKLWERWYKKQLASLDQVGWLERHHIHQRLWVRSQSGHISRLRVQSPIGMHMGGGWSVFLFHIHVSLSFSSINKHILGRGFKKPQQLATKGKMRLLWSDCLSEINWLDSIWNILACTLAINLECKVSLTRWLSWLEHHLIHQKVAYSIPVRSHTWVAGSIPGLDACGRWLIVCTLHLRARSLCLSLPPFPLWPHK